MNPPMASVQQSKGTTILTDDPIGVFKEWAKPYARVSSSVPATMQGNLVSIGVRPKRGHAGEKLNMDCIREKLGKIAGMDTLKPNVVETTFESKIVDHKTGEEVDKTYKIYMIHLDPDNWTDEDTTRGYKKSRVVIRTSVNDKEDMRLLGGSKAKRAPQIKLPTQVQPISQIQPAPQTRRIAPRQPVVQTLPVQQTQPIAHTQPVRPTKPIVQIQSIAEGQPTLPRKPVARSQPVYQTEPGPQAQLVAQTQTTGLGKAPAQTQSIHQTKPMPQIKRAAPTNEKADIKAKSNPKIQQEPKIKVEERANPNILDEYIVEGESQIKSESEC